MSGSVGAKSWVRNEFESGNVVGRLSKKLCKFEEIGKKLKILKENEGIRFRRGIQVFGIE